MSLFMQEEEEILMQCLSDQIKALNYDIKTLEKAVYKNQMFPLNQII